MGVDVGEKVTLSIAQNGCRFPSLSYTAFDAHPNQRALHDPFNASQFAQDLHAIGRGKVIGRRFTLIFADNEGKSAPNLKALRKPYTMIRALYAEMLGPEVLSS